MKKELKKLVLNQETVRNLTPDELQDVVGGFNTMSPARAANLPVLNVIHQRITLRRTEHEDNTRKTRHHSRNPEKFNF